MYFYLTSGSLTKLKQNMLMALYHLIIKICNQEMFFFSLLFAHNIIIHHIYPNSHAIFWISRLSPWKERVRKMGVNPGFERGLLHHNALSTYGTPPGCSCPGSNFVPIWDPFLWRYRTQRIFFTSPCWILLDWDRLG